MKKRMKFITAFAIGLLGLTLLSSPVEAGTLKTMNQNGSNLVPLRVISEELGANVDYNGSNKKITVSYNESLIVTTLGSKRAIVNGKEQELQVAPQLIKGKTYVPIRFIGEALGGLVDYQKGSLTITLGDKVKQWKLETTVYNPGPEKLNKKSYYLGKIEKAKVKQKELENEIDDYRWEYYQVMLLWEELMVEMEKDIKANLTEEGKNKYAQEKAKWDQVHAQEIAKLEDESDHPHAASGYRSEIDRARCMVLVDLYMN